MIAGGVLDREVGEQRRHLRRGDAHDEEGEEADQRDGDRAHRRRCAPRRAFQEVDETLHSHRPSFDPELSAEWASIAG